MLGGSLGDYDCDNQPSGLTKQMDCLVLVEADFAGAFGVVGQPVDYGLSKEQPPDAGYQGDERAVNCAVRSQSLPIRDALYRSGAVLGFCKKITLQRVVG